MVRKGLDALKWRCVTAHVGTEASDPSAVLSGISRVCVGDQAPDAPRGLVVNRALCNARSTSRRVHRCSPRYLALRDDGLATSHLESNTCSDPFRLMVSAGFETVVAESLDTPNGSRAADPLATAHPRDEIHLRRPVRTLVDWSVVVVVVVVIGVFAGLVAAELSGSSIGMLRNGQPDENLVAGSPRGGRSDEWIIATPSSVGADRAGLPEQRQLGLTDTDVLLASHGGPIAGWLTAFRPQDWGYLVFPASRGLAWHWWASFALAIGRLVLAFPSHAGAHSRCDRTRGRGGVLAIHGVVDRSVHRIVRRLRGDLRGERDHCASLRPTSQCVDVVIAVRMGAGVSRRTVVPAMGSLIGVGGGGRTGRVYCG